MPPLVFNHMPAQIPRGVVHRRRSTIYLIALGHSSANMKGRGLAGKDREEESLVLFKELHKREKERLASLLQPISDEFEPHGNYALYKISSGKKVSFLGENDKNDYDWLKTPPATPLFPSLEMEANAPQLVVQREIPILQPLSRFAGNTEASQGSTATSKSPNSKPNIAFQSKLPTINQKMSQLLADPNKPTHTAKVTGQTIISAKSTPYLNQKTKPSRGGVSPSVKSKIPAQIPRFSSDTLPNPRTNRSTSATRDRAAPIPTHQRSRSVTRGRKEDGGLLTTPKGKIQTGNNNGNQFFGSRMVEKVLNARKLGAEANSKPQRATALNNGVIGGGFGRMVSKSSTDKETRGDRINPRPIRFVPGRSSIQQE